ncbi:RHS repeat-associated core domain-containing protein [Streptomyces sp. NPDC058469]|uniref:RHS repeat-associated core domain-containing protein n=1 Tax=Streptomyces sp. NPDC058469 TaxID=3346514 RepID=UPI003648213D
MRTGQRGLQLGDIHGDITVQLRLDTGKAPTVQDTDEYGDTRAGGTSARHHWLGAQQRAGETLSGPALMGARVYGSSTGRFLQLDPVVDGGANAYGHPSDPINMYDLNGSGDPGRSGRSSVIRIAGIRRFVSYVRAMRRGKKVQGAIRHAAAVILGYGGTKAACKGI